MKSHFYAKFVALICCVCVLLSGCSILRDFLKSDREKALDASRPEGAERSPILSDDITDVRVSIVSRGVGIAGDLFGNALNKDASNMEFMQIYYGYCVDGIWTDLPCENYPLVETFISKEYKTNELIANLGYDAVDESHMVKIGPYLLFSIEARYSSRGYLTVGDSLGSEVLLKFEEYDDLNTKDQKRTYGYVKEKHTSIKDGWDLEASFGSRFTARYYVIVKYDVLPKDYVLWVKDSPEDEEYRDYITYDTIMYLLNEYEP